MTAPSWALGSRAFPRNPGNRPRPRNSAEQHSSGPRHFSITHQRAAVPAAPESSNPEELGPRFVIEDPSREGGMAALYKAYDRELIARSSEILLPDLAATRKSFSVSNNELLLASRISHKNILRITI